MKNMNIVYFKDLSLIATITSVGGCTPNSTTAVGDLPDINPCFFIGCDDKGNEVLCAIKTCCGNLELVAAMVTYTAETAPPIIWAVFFGGRPVHAPHG